MSKIEIRGMTWDHSRGYLPMVASAQRFEELNPEVKIVWEKRSLKDFEEYPVEVLAERYDMMIIDHPFVGYAAKHGTLTNLETCLPADFLRDQKANSVGGSHESYYYEGGQWAIAIDAAAPVSLWREDLMERLGLEFPRTWEDLLDLAKRGHVEIPGAPIYCLMNFYSFCVAHGETPFASEERVVSKEVGLGAMDILSELLDACDAGCWSRNPIASQDLLASSANETVAYCPLAYGYINYAREGYAPHRLKYGEPPLWRGQVLSTTLGGTGLAISSQTKHLEVVCSYVEYAASGEVQRCLGTPAGGQPGHRAAWLDALGNQLNGNYLVDTLPVLDRAYQRPRYCGYTRFQEEGGPVLHAGLRGEMEREECLRKLDALYRETLAEGR
ncbi:extracellular solute-binding protein [Pelagicoccus enzymogenes]|uniref:ABC transporter substrate-binding protein n=1 Tax=Pelagicoccus enzymogenes TaxID=2773457 RepID=UPI00281069AF|nr:extracellular solute-binding protein [Pelagicoccus enzymogenes]MDQ8197688.1 extracellular solute-binding protein [Pelagicoccus enzymogenes]